VIGLLVAGLAVAMMASPGVRGSEAAVTVWEGSVLGASDDAEESGTGSVNLSSSDLELVTDQAPQVVGVRVGGVAVPRGATITAAWAQFATDEVSNGTVSLQIRAQDADTAATFSRTTRNVSQRPRTAAAVAWSPPPWPTVGASGPDQRTPGLAPVIQAVVSRPGWQSGNAIALVITGTGRRTADAFGGGQAPRLHVEYTVDVVPPPTNLAPVVSAGPDQTVSLPLAATLSGSATDDGLPSPPGTLQRVWTQVSGPSTMTFSDTSAASTTATFPVAGTYVARLTASDSVLSSSDDTVVTVLAAGTQVAAEARVSGSADDAEEAGGSVSLTSSDLELVRDTADQTVGLRFPALAVPRGARVSQAHVQFQVDEATTEPTALTVRGVDSDSAPQFGSGSLAVSRRPLTDAATSWDQVAQWPTVGATGLAQRTPDISTIVQEVVDRPGWQSGNALAVVITGTGRRTAEAFDGGGAAPVLRLQYDTGSLVNAAPIVDAGPDRVTDAGRSVTLDGHVSDDGLPAGAPVTAQWSVVSGAGTVAFQNGVAPATSVTFSDAGRYQLRLTASDSELTASDDVTVDVAPPGEAVSFAAAGDHAANSRTAASLATLDSSGADFYLALGDLDYDETSTDQAWCDFVLSRLPTLGPSFPFELVVGNHEQQGGPDGYILNHAGCLPDRLGATMGPTGQHAAEYYVDYPPSAPLVRAIMVAPRLTVEGVLYDYSAGTAHRAWLVAAIDAARAQGIPWVVVGMHYGCLTTGPHGCAAGSDLFNLLVGKKVDLVLQGHNHLYERSKQLALNPTTCPALSQSVFDPDCVADDGADGQYVKGAGTVFVVAGTFGVGLYASDASQPDAPYFARINDTTFGLGLYDVVSSRLQGRFLPSVGSFTDAFDITAP